MPVLYIVATPIGNLEDISLRALRVLKHVKLIAAEDTRTTRHLLDKYNIKTRLTSYYEHNKRKKLPILMRALQEYDIAIVSEAGMPGISDTGYELITEAIKNNVQVVVIPGASAVITALISSGLPAEQFVYLGFLPRLRKARKQFLGTLLNEQRTIVVFEAPHRLLKSLDDIKTVLGDRNMAVCRELTKKHEEIYRGNVSQCIDYFQKPRGEFTIVIEGAGPITKYIDDSIIASMKELHSEGFSARKAVKIMAERSGISKKELYSLWIRLEKENSYA